MRRLCQRQLWKAIDRMDRKRLNSIRMMTGLNHQIMMRLSLGRTQWTFLRITVLQLLMLISRFIQLNSQKLKPSRNPTKKVLSRLISKTWGFPDLKTNILAVTTESLLCIMDQLEAKIAFLKPVKTRVLAPYIMLVRRDLTRNSKTLPKSNRI